MEAVYVANGNIVAKNTDSMFDQAVQQGGYALVSGLSDRVSVARFKLLTYVAWDVVARDSTGGSPQDKVFVITTVGGAASAVGTAARLITGGVNADPALASHGSRLYCMWRCDNDVCMSSTADGRTWAAPLRKPSPAGRIQGIDLAEHDGHLYLAGVVGPTGSETLFASQVNVTSSGGDFALVASNADVVPGDHPSPTEGVSLTSGGTTLWLGYVQGSASRLTSFSGTWSAAASQIDPSAGSRPALAFSHNSLYACYRNGSALTVRRRPAGTGAWEAGNPTVNDAQATAAAGIDCHKITVLVGS